MAQQDQKENRVRLDLQATQAQMVLMVVMGRLVIQEETVHQDNLDHQDHGVSVDHQENLAPLEFLELQD